MKTALTIAGIDCSGGAGIQTDIKTMTANGVYAIRAITADLAKGFNLAESVQRAKNAIFGALAAMGDPGEGSGLMDHAFDLRSEYERGVQ